MCTYMLYRHAVYIPYSRVGTVAASAGELFGGVGKAGRAVAVGDVAAALREAVDDVVALAGGGRGVAASGGGRGDEVGEDGVDVGHGLVAASVAASRAVAADGVRGHAQREQSQGDKQHAAAHCAKLHGIFVIWYGSSSHVFCKLSILDCVLVICVVLLEKNGWSLYRGAGERIG